MVSKPHRNNSDFQLRYFMAGSCKTPDGAWMLLYGQKIDIEVKIKHSKSQQLRRDAAIAKAESILSNPSSKSWDKLIAEADLIENKAGDESWKLNAKAAIEELATIEDLMGQLEPLCKYSHLPLLERNEAAQREEWLLELNERAENFILSQGSIPHDHLHTMRCHPDFKTKIAPHISGLLTKMQSLQSVSDGIKLLSEINTLLLPERN